jgi:hypothetical protein
MPAPLLYPTFSYAGGSAKLADLSYTASVGISPGVAVVRVGPTAAPPPVGGDFAFGDGLTAITLRDCHIDRNGFRADASRAGKYYTIRLVDRRWRWQDGYAVSGHYNQLDSHNKLLPASVRSPFQLATMLLQAMGETGFAVDMPPGLAVPAFYSAGGDYSAAATYKVTVNGVLFQKTGPGTGVGSPTMADVVRTLADDVNAWTTAPIRGTVVASVSGDRLVLSRVKATDALTVTASSTGLPAGKTWTLLAVAPGPRDSVVDPTTEYFQCGANAAQTGANPPARWDAVPAAVALALLAEQYGRLVVWDPVTDLTSLQVQGTGSGLPDGKLVSTGPSVDPKQVPRRYTVLGDPTVFQGRVALDPVAQDYDGDWRRLADLSYAPDRDEQKMVVKVSGKLDPAANYYGLTVNGVLFSTDGAGATGFGDVLGDLLGQVTASGDPAVAGKVEVTTVDGASVLRGVDPGYEFEAAVSALRPGAVPAADGTIEATCLKGPVKVVPRPQTQTVTVTATPSPYGPTDTSQYIGVAINGVTFSESVGLNADSTALTAAVAALAAAVTASTADGVTGRVSAAAAGLVLALTQLPATEPFGFSLDGTVLVPPASWTVTVTVGPLTTAGGRGFEKCPPPTFPLVKPTDRLNRYQAERLAEAGVFRCYKVRAVGPADGSQGIPVPGRPGRVYNPYLLLIRPTRPEQMEPRPPDAARVDPQTLQPVAAEVYDGYSQDRPNAAFGSVNFAVMRGGYWAGPSSFVFTNSPKRTQFYVPFGVADPERQVFQFAEPVYRRLGDTYLPPDLVVECGYLLLDPVTFAPVRFRYSLDVPGGEGPEKVVVRPDVREEVIGTYDEDHTLTGFRSQDFDCRLRADYYAREEVKKYATTLGQTNVYGLIRPVSLSGAVRQVSWAMGRDGVTTTASANTEHSTAVVPYPARRFRENAPADPVQAAWNLRTDLRPAANAVVQWGQQAANRVRGWFGMG